MRHLDQLPGAFNQFPIEQRAPRRADGAAMPESRMFAREEMAEYDGDMSGEHTRLACWFRRLAETIFRSKFNSDRRD